MKSWEPVWEKDGKLVAVKEGASGFNTIHKKAGLLRDPVGVVTRRITS